MGTVLALVWSGKTEFDTTELALNKMTESALSRFVRVACKPLSAAARMFQLHGNQHTQVRVVDKLTPVVSRLNKQVAEQLTHNVMIEYLQA